VYNKSEGGLNMKNIRAKRETSREYLMKLMYQTYISNGDITDLENEMEEFLQNNKEYIVSRYKELVLTYSDKDVDFEGLSLEKCVDRVYLNEMCDILRFKIDYINELIET
jgi:N utilization substance protein B